MSRTPFLCLAAVTLVAACAGAGSSPSGDLSMSAAPTPVAVPSPTSGGEPIPSEKPTPVATSAAPTPPPLIESAGATRFAVDQGPDWLALAGGTLWTAAGRGIVQLDPVTGTQTATTEILGICLGLGVGYRSLWVGGCDAKELVRVDPATGAVITQIALPIAGLQEEGSVGVGEGGVWVVSSDHQLTKVDSDTNKVAGAWQLPTGAAAVRAGLGSVWVTVSDSNQLLRVDPSDPTVQTPIDVGEFPRFLAVGSDAIWVMNQRDATVSRVTADGSVVATIPFGEGPMEGGDIAVGGGSVWVQPNDALLVRIDPNTNQAIDVYGPRSGSGSVIADDTAAWVSAHDVNAIWRLPLP